MPVVLRRIFLNSITAFGNFPRPLKRLPSSKASAMLPPAPGNGAAAAPLPRTPFNLFKVGGKALSQMLRGLGVPKGNQNQADAFWKLSAEAWR